MQTQTTNDNSTLTKASPRFSLAERFEFGRFNLREIAVLAGVSLGKVYGDVREGKLETFTHGRQRFATGPNVRRYVQGDSP